MVGFLTILATGTAVGSGVAWVQRQRRQKRDLVKQLDAQTTRQIELEETVTALQTKRQSSEPLIAGVLILDRLEAITGLTPHHARLLNAAGILTYADLAQLSAEKIAVLIAPSGGARIDLMRWIEQATDFAARDPLPNWYGGTG